MPNQLNIKTEEARRLAASLARLTGESLTTAVTAALKERLDREQHNRDSAMLKARLLGIAAEIRASLKCPDRDRFYDGRGFPR